MNEKKADDYRLRQRNRSRLEKAWELFMGLRLGGALPRDAIVQTEAAMEVWRDYEDRNYVKPPPEPEAGRGFYGSEAITDFYGNVQRELGERSTVPAMPESAVTTEHPPLSHSDMSLYTPDRRLGSEDTLVGRWVTKNGSLATVRVDLHACDPGKPSRFVGSVDGGHPEVYWDRAGICTSSPWEVGYTRPGDWDLMARVTGQVAGNFVPPTNSLASQLGSEAPPELQLPSQPPLDFSGRWLTLGGHLVSVISTPAPALKGYPYANGVGSEVPSFGMYWNAEGRAITPDTGLFNAQYDLMERAPSPGGHRMDYPLDAIPKED